MKFSQLLNRKDSIKEKAQTAFVRASKLFDERWYASRYQDVFKKLKDPARHYYLVGWKENRNPSENFDTASYLRQYPECGICPIVFEHNRNDYADLAVCTIVKDEAPYIKEWLDYHLMVGVKRFYIYDNESFDNLKQVLLPYIRQGVVIYQYYPGEAMQLNCYRDCLKQYGDKNEWIAFIDADEFIIPMENATIPEFLADYKAYPAVGVNWVSYDSNGHKEKPKGGVLENYTRVHYDENLVPFHLIKSIVRPQEVSKVINPHFFLYKGDKLAVNENKEEIGGDLSERAYISPFSTNKIRINHYYCKSHAEAEAKVLRGSSDRNNGQLKNILAKELNFSDYKYDYTAYKFVLQLSPEKAKVEEIKMAWLRLKNALIEFKHSINPNQLYEYIDEKWYFEQYPDAKESGIPAAKHYMNVGWRMGYNPSEKFNTEFYLNKYKDVAKAHICPLLHYLNSGKNEGRLAYEDDENNNKSSLGDTIAVKGSTESSLNRLSKWGKSLFKEKEREYNELWQNKAYFDENWYLKQYPDVKESGMSAKKHYDTIGWLQGYNPSAKFKTNEYLKQYPECKICPIDFEYNRNRYVDLAVCAIMKNEAPYVKEWLDYHQMVGVKRFYIYDNESNDDLCQVLLPYIRQGTVVYKNYPGEAKQMPAYNEFIKEYGDKNEWVAFIDADEFIIPMEKESIPEFLADYKEYPGVGINWVAYDSNEHKAKPKGGVLENYTRVHYDENLVPFHQIKSIVQPSQVDKIINPHYALFKDNKLAVNENKQEIGGSLEDRAYISPFSANKIRINHYFCKSEEEYKAKIERGRAPTKRSVKRVYNQNQVFFDDYKYDYSAYRFVTKLKPEIAQDEEVKYVWQKMKNAWIAFKHSFNPNPLYDYIDEKWYFEQYPDAKESKMSAAEHYMNIGWRKGYNPSKKFDTNFYLKKYKDVAKMHVCPLLHYLNSGKKENRLAHEGYENNKSFLSDVIAVNGSTESTSQTVQADTAKQITELVSLPLLNHLCQWCKTLFKGKEEKYNELWDNKEYFDEDWYVANYKEACSYKKGPKAHYRAEGWKKGYNASEKFNTEEYLKQYPECKICPIDFEWNKIKVTHVDEQWYFEQYPDARESGLTATEHYNTIGWKKGYNPNTEFDTNFYLDHYPDVAKVGINPLTHYIKNGREEGRSISRRLADIGSDIVKTNYQIIKRVSKNMEQNKIDIADYELIKNSNLFDSVWYNAIYSDVKNADMDPVLHFMMYGWKENRDPSQKFSISTYLRLNEDVKELNVNPLLHYLKVGVLENRKYKDGKFLFHKKEVIKYPDYNIIANSKYFDGNYYLSHHPEVKKYRYDPVEHYLKYGWKAGFNPSAYFDGNKYLEEDDIKKTKINPLLHWEKFGKKEGRSFPINESKVIKKKIGMKKGVIYTCITGTYDKLIKHQIIDENFDYICYTDNDELLNKKEVNGWCIRPTQFNKLDNIRNARWHKVNPDILFPDYDLSVWVDANVDVLSDDLHRRIVSFIKNKEIFFSYSHPLRNSVFDEAIAVMQLKKDFVETVQKELEYLNEEKFPDTGGLHETSVLIRNHKNEVCKNVSRMWWNMIDKYSRRDQLGLDYALWKYNYVIKHLKENDIISEKNGFLRTYGKHHKGNTMTIEPVKTISVIIPIYNALDDVARCLDSILDAKLTDNVEIICINDCSEQETTQYLRNFCSKNQRFTLVENEENLGFIKTCNKGMKMAKGDILVLLNSDTLIPKAFEKKILFCFNKDKTIGCASPISSNTGLWHVTMPSTIKISAMDRLVESVSAKKFPSILCPEGFCFCIRNIVVKEIGYLDEVFGKGYCEETDLSMRALSKGWRLALIDNMYVWHKHEASFGSATRAAAIKKNSVILWERWRPLYDLWSKKINMKALIEQTTQDIFNAISEEKTDEQNNHSKWGYNVHLFDNITGHDNEINIKTAMRESIVHVEMYGHHNKIEIDEPYRIKNIHIYVGSKDCPVNHCLIKIGAGLSSGDDVYIRMYTSGSKIIIGKDCLLSWNVSFRSGEQPHLIFDNKTGEYLDGPSTMSIGNHVWIGENVAILKRASIANDCVVGLGAVVTKAFTKDNCVIAGNPAKICKENIHWEKNVKCISVDSKFKVGKPKDM